MIGKKKKGKPYKFTPEQFEKAWEDYFEYCDSNPWQRSEVIKSGPLAGQVVKVPIQRPYTEIGFCAFHGLGEAYLRQLAASLERKNDENSKELSSVLSRARAKCYTQKFEGAAIGAFNANIIARELGLANRAEINVMAEQPLFGDDEETEK